MSQNNTSTFSDEVLIEMAGNVGYEGSKHDFETKEDGEIAKQNNIKQFIDDYNEKPENKDSNYEMIEYYDVEGSDLQYTIMEDKETREIVIVFQGSVGGMEELFNENGDWPNNLQNAVHQVVPQYEEVESIIKNLVERYGDRIVAVTGNSLGGGLAIVAAQYLSDSVRIIPLNPAPTDIHTGGVYHPNMVIVLGSTDPLSQLIMLDLSRLPEGFQTEYEKLEKQLSQKKITVYEFNQQLEELRTQYNISSKDIYGSEVLLVNRPLSYSSSYGIELAHVGYVYFPEAIIGGMISFEKDGEGKDIYLVMKEAVPHLNEYQVKRLHTLVERYQNYLVGEESSKLSTAELKELYNYLYYGLDTLQQREVDQSRLADSLSRYMAFDLLSRNLLNLETGKLYGQESYTFEVASMEEVEIIVSNLSNEVEDYRRNVVDFSFENINLAIDKELEVFPSTSENLVMKLLYACLDQLGILVTIKSIARGLEGNSIVGVAELVSYLNMDTYSGSGGGILSSFVPTEVNKLLGDLVSVLEEEMKEYSYDQTTGQDVGIEKTLQEFNYYLKNHVDGACGNLLVLGENFKNTYQYFHDVDEKIAGKRSEAEFVGTLSYGEYNRNEVGDLNYVVVYQNHLLSMIENVISCRLEEFRIHSHSKFMIVENKVKNLIDVVLMSLEVLIVSIDIRFIDVPIDDEGLAAATREYNQRIEGNRRFKETLEEYRDELRGAKEGLDFSFALNQAFYYFTDEIVSLLLSDSIIGEALYNYRYSIEVSEQMLGVIRNLNHYIEANSQGKTREKLISHVRKMDSDLKFILNEMTELIGDGERYPQPVDTYYYGMHEIR